MKNPEAIYLNWGQDGEVIADFTPGICDVLVDAYTYGYAMRRTTQALGIIRHDPAPSRMTLFGDNDIVIDRLPNFERQAEEIAKTSSFEQPYYGRNPGRECQAAVTHILKDLIQTLPVVTREETFMDICERIVLPFTAAAAINDEPIASQNFPAPWRKPEYQIILGGK